MPAVAAVALAQSALAQEPEATPLQPPVGTDQRVPSTLAHPSNARAEAAGRQIPGRASVVRPGVAPTWPRIPRSDRP